MIKSMICVCNTNTCRSPMFAALLRKAFHEVGLEINVESAGVCPGLYGKPADKKARASMGKRDLSLDDHRSRYLGDIDIGIFDMILCMNMPVMKAIPAFKPKSSTIVACINMPDGISGPRQRNQNQKIYNRCAKEMREVIWRIVNQIKPAK